MITGNEPAMPITEEAMATEDSKMPNTIIRCKSIGLTIRQQFAMAAMQGLIANSDLTGWPADEIAKEAVTCANALIAELNKATE